MIVNLAVALFLAPRELALRLAGQSRSGDLPERLGKGVRRGFGSPFVVIHAVSIGEMAAAGALVSELVARLPGVSIALTTGNRDGVAAGERLMARHTQIVSTSLLPWDRRAAMASWLARLRPSLVAVVETEIWPSLFRACTGLKIPIVIVNGRMPAADAARYRLARAFFRDVLRRAAWIEAQSDEDARRFIDIGADPNRVCASENLKFDSALSIAEEDAVSSAQGGLLLVAGSTHAPEEDLLLDVFAELRGRYPKLRLVLAPRHVSRSSGVAQRARRRGLRAALDSEEPFDTDVLVVGRVGRLSAFYAVADIAVIGGTFADRGGHNPIEAAARGLSAIAGPSRRNFREIFSGLEAAGGLVSADSPERLNIELSRLLDDDARRKKIGTAALRYCRARQGTARACARRIADAVSSGHSRSRAPFAG